jgi:hypothetical protein
MAHQDVVPVNPSTLNQWTHNPFDGVIEDGWVWGRGAADCKNQVCLFSGVSQWARRAEVSVTQLMGIMSALDKLIQDEYKPERTILVAFGFDEEIGGVQVRRGSQSARSPYLNPITLVSRELLSFLRPFESGTERTLSLSWSTRVLEVLTKLMVQLLLLWGWPRKVMSTWTSLLSG